MATTGAVLARSEQGGLAVDTPAMSRAQATRLTEQIRHGIEGVWAKMYEAYTKNAHHALGYERWEDYVREEFKMTRGESYRLVNQGKVIYSLAAAGGVTRAREAAPYVSMRQAEVLKNDLDVAAVEITRDIEGGMDTEEAVRKAVERRKVPTNGHSPTLPHSIPAIPRRSQEVDEGALLESAAELRERLKDVPLLVKRQMGAFPRKDAANLDDLHTEFRAWVMALSNFTNEQTIKSINLLRAELFEWLSAYYKDSREDIGELAKVGEANVDYWRRELKVARGEAAPSRRKRT